MTALAKDADVLVCEVNDLEASMKAIAAKAGVKSVVLTHYSPGLDGEADLSPYTNGVRKFFSGPVIAGRDLLEY